MSTKESEDKKTETLEDKSSETVTISSTKDKSFLGLNFNDTWTLVGTAVVTTGLGAITAYLLGPSIRQFLDNIKSPVQPQPVTAATATVPTPQELEKKYYADRIRQQKLEEQQFYENLNKQHHQPTVKKRITEPGNYYDQYENDIPFIDDNDIMSNISRRKYVEEPVFRINDDIKKKEVPQPSPRRQDKKEEAEEELQQQPPMFAKSQKIPEEELQVYTDDKIDINKLPPEFTNVGNNTDDYDITNLEMTEEELNNLAKNSGNNES